MRSLLFVSIALVACLLILSPPPQVEAVPAPVPCCGRGAAFVGGAIVGGAIARRRSWGGGCGGCYSCCGRKKRGITDAISNQIIEEFHEKIAMEDSDQCGLRLVCELAHMEDHQLTENEKLIMLPYRGDGGSTGTKYGLYDEAAWHGQEGRECHELYPLCAFSAPEIMWHTSQINITEPILTI